MPPTAAAPRPAPVLSADLASAHRHSERPDTTAWTAWQRVLFRFFVLYWLLQVAPWSWLGDIPGIGRLVGAIDVVTAWAVTTANAHLFHVRAQLIAPNGSGDTSFAWAQLWLYLLVAVVGAAVWTLVDRARGADRHLAHGRLLYWLRTFLRYYLAATALSYGIIKLFALQMPFPTLSQLATPLGDLLPMRLSWMFVGYSTTYQVFSGVVETVAGLLLLRRNTVTLGLLLAAGAFANVLMINLAYDVPVKLFAAHLVLACAFLLALDARRLFSFLVLNRAAPATTGYEPYYARPWHRYAAMGAKALIILLVAVLPFVESLGRYRAQLAASAPRPFRRGVYDVRRFVRNGDTIPAFAADSLRWRDVIFDDGSAGSVGTADSAFQRRYGRGYFRYAADTARHTVALWRVSPARDSAALFTIRYQMPDSSTVRLWTRMRGDSVYAELVRTDRRFPLAERQFHWLSEYNR